MELSFILYRSRPRDVPDEDMVLGILTESMRRNPGEGLTGFLHVERDLFLQYLEGHLGPLSRKIAGIRKDRRHTDFQILAEGTVVERLFPDWDMGQIPTGSFPTTGLLAERPWREAEPDIDPLPLLKAFAAHAEPRGDVDIAMAG